MSSKTDQQSQGTEPRTPLRILSIAAVLSLIPISRRHLYRLEAANLFPKRIAVGPRRRGYIEADIREWIATRNNITEGK